MVFNPRVGENSLLAQQIRELERINPGRARKLMYSNPKLLVARRLAALDALRRKI